MNACFRRSAWAKRTKQSDAQCRIKRLLSCDLRSLRNFSAPSAVKNRSPKIAEEGRRDRTETQAEFAIKACVELCRFSLRSVSRTHLSFRRPHSPTAAEHDSGSHGPDAHATDSHYTGLPPDESALRTASAEEEFADSRRDPRFKLETELRIYPRNRPVLRAYTIDISESGISAMLRVEVPLDEIVRLEFSLPMADVEIYAVVRQRNAFRYGFQFVGSCSGQHVIAVTCRQLARAGGV